jgi:hypothetical protein
MTMPARQAMVLVADEILYNLHGKAILQGIYHSDLGIATNPSRAPQLIFFFMIETDMTEPFQSLQIEVTLPGGESVRALVPVPPPAFITAQTKTQTERTRFYVRHPLLIPAPVLRPGNIRSRIIHESGEIVIDGPWITHRGQERQAKPV